MQRAELGLPSYRPRPLGGVFFVLPVRMVQSEIVAIRFSILQTSHFTIISMGTAVGAANLRNFEAKITAEPELYGKITVRHLNPPHREESQIQYRFAAIEQDIGPIEVVVSNTDGNVNFPIQETTERVFYKLWKMASLTGFLTGREAAKFGLRALAPGMARELGPQGIHVAHLIIDSGSIKGDRSIIF